MGAWTRGVGRGGAEKLTGESEGGEGHCGGRLGNEDEID